MMLRSCMARMLRDERGQATVEAAFAVPVLMVLVLMLVQPGIILYDRIVMEGAAAAGCRLLATLPESDAELCEDFVMRRLGAVPPHDFFHVHGGGCSWEVELSGSEASSKVEITISTEVKPLPLIGFAAVLMGAGNDEGNLVVEVTSAMSTQPAWALESRGSSNPAEWVGAWLS